MVVKVDKYGNRIHSPPYTKAEEDEFYRRVGGGPVTIAPPQLVIVQSRRSKTAAAVAGKTALSAINPGGGQFLANPMTGVRAMAKIIWKDSDPSDPMYSEGPRSYSPHWARGFQKSKTKPTPATKPPASDRKATERDDDGSGTDNR